MKRYDVMWSNTVEETHEQSRVAIEAINLLCDNKDGGVCVQIKFHNAGESVLTNLAIDVDLFEQDGSRTYMVKSYQYNGLSVEPNGSFGQDELITLPVESAARVQATIVYAKYSNGTVWSARAEVQKKNKKKLAIAAGIVGGAIVVAAAAFGILSFLRANSMRTQYDNAMNLYNAGEYEEASRIFLDLWEYDYKDSESMYFTCIDERKKQEEQEFFNDLVGVYQCDTHKVIDETGTMSGAEYEKEYNEFFANTYAELGMEFKPLSLNRVGQQVEIVEASASVIFLNMHHPCFRFHLRMQQ